MVWNEICGIENACIDYQRIAKNELFTYSNWNGMEWNEKCKNQELHIPKWNGMEWNENAVADAILKNLIGSL